MTPRDWVFGFYKLPKRVREMKDKVISELSVILELSKEDVERARATIAYAMEQMPCSQQTKKLYTQTYNAILNQSIANDKPRSTWVKLDHDELHRICVSLASSQAMMYRGLGQDYPERDKALYDKFNNLRSKCSQDVEERKKEDEINLSLGLKEFETIEEAVMSVLKNLQRSTDNFCTFEDLPPSLAESYTRYSNALAKLTPIRQKLVYKELRKKQ